MSTTTARRGVRKVQKRGGGASGRILIALFDLSATSGRLFLAAILMFHFESQNKTN